jgi:hypothetical protein
MSAAAEALMLVDVLVWEEQPATARIPAIRISVEDVRKRFIGAPFKIAAVASAS